MSREPKRLVRGREAHKALQQEWLADEKDARVEVKLVDASGRQRRADVVVDVSEDCVAVVELKNTDWDRMKPYRVRPNALRHARQVWKYIEAYFDVPDADGKTRDVCPGIVYTRLPQDSERLEEIEAAHHERGIQVVWEDESMDAVRERNDPSA